MSVLLRSGSSYTARVFLQPLDAVAIGQQAVEDDEREALSAKRLTRSGDGPADLFSQAGRHQVGHPCSAIRRSVRGLVYRDDHATAGYVQRSTRFV
jgi:hypothetical protein